MADYFEQVVATIVSKVAGIPTAEISSSTPIPFEHHTVIGERVVAATRRPLRVVDWRLETVGSLASKCRSEAGV